MTSVSEAQTIRQQRAREQAQDYIITPNWEDPDAFDVIGRRGQCYTVTPEGCNCPDAERRSEGHCKHWHMVREHVAKLVNRPQPHTLAMSAEKLAQVRKDRELWG